MKKPPSDPILPPNVRLFGVVKQADGWVSAEIKVDSAGKIVEVKASEPGSKTVALYRTKIDFVRSSARDDGVYHD